MCGRRHNSQQHIAVKTFIKLILLVGIIVYLCFAFVDFSSHADTTTCRQVNFTVADSSHAGFITAEEADRLLRNSGLYPVGRQMDKVDGAAIEQALCRNSFIWHKIGRASCRERV